jgi:secondary thiamine-phosphate synthase enzyme
MITTRQVALNTKGNCDIIDITPEIEREISGVGIIGGTVTVFIPGSTAGITTIEFESGVLNDLKVMWDSLVPKNITYEHDRRWGDGNGYSHVRASLLGASLTIPFSNGKLMVGTWQQIVLIDFDNRPRSRSVILQIMGE